MTQISGMALRLANSLRRCYPSSVRLVSTFTSLHELGATHKLYASPLEVRAAAASLLRHSDLIEVLDPLTYVASIENAQLRDRMRQGKIILSEMRRLAATDASTLEDFVRSKRDEIRRRVVGFSSDAHRAMEKINSETLLEVKVSVKRTTKAGHHRNKDDSMGLRNLLMHFVKDEIGYELSAGFNWSRLNLVMRVWGVYFKDLELSKQKTSVRDWKDLFNMVYVNPERKYWTRDRRWNSYIQRAGLSAHIFDPNL